MPLKFKTRGFVKYDDTGYPYAHVCMFYRKMVLYGDNPPLLSQVFLDSLIGPTTTWYLRL